MMDNQFAKLPAIVPLSRGRHVSRGASSRHVTHSAAAGKWKLMFILHPHLGPPLLPAGALPGGGQEAARSR